LKSFNANNQLTTYQSRFRAKLLSKLAKKLKTSRLMREIYLD